MIFDGTECFDIRQGSLECRTWEEGFAPISIEAHALHNVIDASKHLFVDMISNATQAKQMSFIALTEFITIKGDIMKTTSTFDGWFFALYDLDNLAF